MGGRARRLLGALAALALAATMLVVGAGAARADDGIRARLEAIPGMRVLSEKQLSGHTFFMLAFRQPVDHGDPSRGTFEQRLNLLHRSTDRPMILHTTGYDVPDYAFTSEPTRLVDGNQVSVEERYFTPSRPDPTDWRYLNIWQAAADHHRVVQALKPIYTKPWISTGASKGGMATVYHKVLYPHDLAGAVPYVAPDNTNVRDQRPYTRFLQTVGTASCRAALTRVQRFALSHRKRLDAKYAAAAADNKWTFDILGSVDRALEMAVEDTAWAFWQYHGRSECDSVPGPDLTVDGTYAFLDKIDGMDFYADQGAAPYIPYYYQAGTQLGWPEPDFARLGLRGLVRYPGLYTPRSNVPREIPMRFDPRVMPAIDKAVRFGGSRLLFVYGQADPWSVKRFRLGPGTRDSALYVAPGANHGADIAGLDAADRKAATDRLLRWAGVPASSVSLKVAGTLPDDSGLRAVRRPL